MSHCSFRARYENTNHEDILIKARQLYTGQSSTRENAHGKTDANVFVDLCPS